MRRYKLAIHIFVMLSVFNFVAVLAAPVAVQEVREACAGVADGSEDVIIVPRKRAEEVEGPWSWSTQASPRSGSESEYSPTLQHPPGSPSTSDYASGVHQETTNPIELPSSASGEMQRPPYASGGTEPAPIPLTSSVRTKADKWVPTTENPPAWVPTTDPAWVPKNPPAWVPTTDPAWVPKNPPAWVPTTKNPPAWVPTTDPAWEPTTENPELTTKIKPASPVFRPSEITPASSSKILLPSEEISPASSSKVLPPSEEITPVSSSKVLPPSEEITPASSSKTLPQTPTKQPKPQSKSFLSNLTSKSKNFLSKLANKSKSFCWPGSCRVPFTVKPLNAPTTSATSVILRRGAGKPLPVVVWSC